MTGKTTQQLAREAGIEDYNEMLRSVVVTDNGTYINPVTMADLERFRALVLEEAAAKVRSLASSDTDWDTSDWNQAVERCALALKEKP